ncbi:MAG: energy-coupling factor ABC transporter ATP-binding protein [Proteobacteria bacterium]|nr:energy-coupling factor ABC transporter ATP-binding protein [Pseudomonadota bacterium]
MKDPIFDLCHIKHEYQEKTVFEEDHLGISPGTITGLTGPNGSGKSTLLNILGLIIKPTHGVVTFMGYPVGPFSDKARHSIALLPQQPYLLKRSVFNNVAYGLFIRKDTVNLKHRVFEALDAVGLSPDQFAHRHDHQLSGGEARRVALASRLVLRPEVLLLDEPTSHVDEQSSRLMRTAVLNARDIWKTTLVISSHDREWLYSISDTVLTLFRGRIYHHGRINILYGPWEKWKDDLYHGPGHDNACPLPVPEPPHDHAVAILPARFLGLKRDKDAIPEGAFSLFCHVTGISIERKTKKIFVFLMNGKTPLISEVNDEYLSYVKPGMRVNAYYYLNDFSFS